MVDPSSGYFHFNGSTVDKYLLNALLHARNHGTLLGGVMA